MSFIDSLREYYQYHPTERLWYPKSGRSDFDYSDGAEVEERILSILASANDVSSYSIELRNSICDWPTLYHLSPNRSNLLRPFVNDLKGEILELGAGFGAITRFIAEQGGSILAVEGSARRAQGASLRCKDLNNVHFVVDTFDSFNLPYQFDVITIIGVLEYAQKYFPKDNQEDGIRNLLIKVNSLLKANGLLIVAIENQLGLKYFCGAPEDHYGVPFLGINDAYPENNVITFGKRELEFRLKQAGFAYQKWWYAFPDYKLPVCMFSSNIDDEKIGYDFSPIIAYSSTYDPQKPRNPIFSLEQTWSVVLRNGLLSSLANSFLVMARKAEREEVYDDRVCCYYSLDRRKEFAKEVVFRINTGKGTILLDKKLLFPQEKSDPSIPLSVQLEDEDTVIGQNWQWSLVKKLNKPSWCITDITEWAQVWTAALSEYISTRFSIDTNFSIHTPLPGDLFDAVPRNLVVLPGGKTRFIDQKWKLSIEIEFGYLLFRGLFLSILEVSSVEYPLVGTPVNIFQLFKLVTQHLGFWVTPSDFARYLQMESDIQKWALGKEVNLDLETYLGFNLNIRQSALNNSEQMVQIFQQLAEREQALEGLRAELSASRERAALLEGQLAEREQALEGLQVELSASRERAALLEGQLAEREQALEGLRAELSASRERAALLEGQLAEREQALEGLRAELSASRERVALLEGQLAEREQALEGLRAELSASRERAALLEGQLADREQQNTALTLQKAALQQELDALRSRYENLQQHQQEREQILQNLNNTLLEIYSSTAWKIIQWMWRVRLWLAPRGSWREKVGRNLLGVLKKENKKQRGKLSDEKITTNRVEIEKITSEQSEYSLDKKPGVNSTKPIVSVIIPCFNDGLFIDEALQSINQQTYSPIEIIVVNDGSDDRLTIEKIRSLENSSIRVINIPNSGPAAARNLGIQYSNGKYILPLDADDKIHSDYITKAVEIMEKDEEVGIVYCFAEFIGNKKGKWNLPPYNLRTMLLDNVIFATALYRKEDWEKVGGYDESLRYGMEDYDFWLSIIEINKKVYQIPEVMFFYRIKSNSRTYNFNKNLDRVKATYQKIYRNHPRLYNKNKDLYASALRDALIDLVFEKRELRTKLGLEE
jgi:glycosyltransferase involved in cell wall biosynthesis/SAM-dependent methyltransferase